MKRPQISFLTLRQAAFPLALVLWAVVAAFHHFFG
jgi:hypothetical protein